MLGIDGKHSPMSNVRKDSAFPLIPSCLAIVTVYQGVLSVKSTGRGFHEGRNSILPIDGRIWMLFQTTLADDPDFVLEWTLDP